MDPMTREALEALEASIMIRCPCCYGRGYQPERRRSGRGFGAGLVGFSVGCVAMIEWLERKGWL